MYVKCNTWILCPIWIKNVKDLTKDIKKLTSLKYLSEYEFAIKETYDELFTIET